MSHCFCYLFFFSINFPNGLKTEFYNSTDLSGNPTLIRNDVQIDYQWYHWGK
jgi:hypothetical protein